MKSLQQRLQHLAHLRKRMQRHQDLLLLQQKAQTRLLHRMLACSEDARRQAEENRNCEDGTDGYAFAAMEAGIADCQRLLLTLLLPQREAEEASQQQRCIRSHIEAEQARQMHDKSVQDASQHEQLRLQKQLDDIYAQRRQNFA